MKLFRTVMLLYLQVIMSFSIKAFVESPKLPILVSLKKADLSALAQCYKLEITSIMKKSNIQKLLVEY